MQVELHPPDDAGWCRIQIARPLPHVPEALFVALDGRPHPFWTDGPYALEFAVWTGHYGYSARIMAPLRAFVAGELDQAAAAAVIAQALRQWSRLRPASDPPPR